MEAGICFFESVGSQVLLVNGRHHRKLAMIDRKILWEGSLNILSQTYSREFMRRIESKELTNELFQYEYKGCMDHLFPEIKELMVDGTERKIQRPKNKKQQNKTYSGKKKIHARKNIIVSDKHKKIHTLFQ